MPIEEIQAALRDEHLDGWLFFDHHQRDPLAYRILKLNPQRVATRRWYYFIPAHGEPKGLVHTIEPDVLAGLPGDVRKYSSWSAQVEGLHLLLAGAHRITGHSNADLAAVNQLNRGVQDHLIARLHTAVDLDLPPEIPYDRYLAQMHRTVLDHGEL